MRDQLLRQALDEGWFDRIIRELPNIGLLVNGRYVHWDKLRLLKPSADLTPTQWWLAVKMRRSMSGTQLPLRDCRGEPFTYCLPDIALHYLHEVDQKAGGQLATAEKDLVTSGDRDRYLVRSLVEEAITSSQLEGATTTRPIAKEMIRSGRSPRDVSEQMILNNYRAMEWIRSLDRERELDEEMLLELHRTLTLGTLSSSDDVGRFRSTSEDDKIRVFDAYDEALHTPPPSETLPERMKLLFDFANGRTPDYYIPPIIRAIILHFWLAYEHPFVDGNGRSARALFYWSMLRQGAWLCEYVSISEVIKKARSRYGRAFLYVETDENDLTYFILYHLELLTKAFAALHQYIDAKSRAIREVEVLLRRSDRLNNRQLALLSHALRHPGTHYTVASHGSSHRISAPTARSDLQELVQMGLLEARKSGKAVVYDAVAELELRLRRAT
jgi:Fic family protein